MPNYHYTKDSPADIVEHHFHNEERYLGARAGWDGSNTVNAASNDSMTSFQIDAGNDTWGTPLCILGSGDTPVRASQVYFDLRRILVTDSQRTAPYRVRFAYGSSYAAAITAGHFTEWEFIGNTAVFDSGPVQIFKRRLPAGSILFAAAWCLGQPSGTIDFTYGIHEYSH